MTRVSAFSSPLLLGFEELERLLDRAAKCGGDGYPPYNIERQAPRQGEPERISISLAVAGFSRDDLDVTVEENQLFIRGNQADEDGKTYLHRGIAARKFQRVFVLADGMQVTTAQLANGMLTIDLERPEPENVIRRIEISDG